MLNPKEALKKAQEKQPNTKLVSAIDFGRFYGFFLKPDDFPDDVPYKSGTTVIAVDKNSGRVFPYEITSNIMLFNNAKDIKRLI